MNDAVNLKNAICNKWLEGKKDIYLEIAFDENNHLFHDFFEQKENKEELLEVLADYTELKLENTKIIIKNLSNEEKKEKDLRSQFELEELELERKKQESRDKIRKNPYIMKAEKLFDTKINNITVKEE